MCFLPVDQSFIAWSGSLGRCPLESLSGGRESLVRAFLQIPPSLVWETADESLDIGRMIVSITTLQDNADLGHDGTLQKAQNQVIKEK